MNDILGQALKLIDEYALECANGLNTFEAFEGLYEDVLELKGGES